LLDGKLVDPTFITPRLQVIGEKADRLSALYRQFSPGESHRCHHPTFGLCFISGTKLIGAASICWECTNLYFHVDGERSLYGFDRGVPAARELLATLCRETGVAPPDVS
jgi:hypothetical protein